MEKTNKYYGVIENLVKQNRKFQGLEAILDDIIDDVYSHSEVIINSINNDGVIQSYLEKVVSTSIITVPKKMGFHPEIKHRTIDAQQVLENVAQRKAEKVNTELVDRMINNIPVEVQNNEVYQETTESVSELTKIKPEDTTLMQGEAPFEVEPIEEDNVSSINEEDTSEEIQDNALEDFVASDSLETEDLNEVETIVATDKTQDDTLENFVTSDSLETEDLDEIVPAVEAEEPAIEESLDISDLNEEQELVEENQSDSLELNDLDEISIDETNESKTANDEIQDFEKLETEELEPVVDSDISAIEEPAVNNEVNTIESSNELSEPVLEIDDLTGDDFEALEPTDTLDLDLQEEDNQTSLLDTEPLEENPLDVINDNGLEQIADVITTTLENPENTSTEEIDFKPTDYSVFSYSTDKYKDDIDAEEIVNEIKDLASKHPELNIINVYNLKFKDKLTIPQVASELNMSEDNVIEALNELVAIVQ